MTLQDGDLVTMEDPTHGTLFAEVVGVTSRGYDVVRFLDNSVVRYVPREQLQTPC